MDAYSLLFSIAITGVALAGSYKWWRNQQVMPDRIERVLVPAVGDLTGPGTYEIEVISESSYQQTLDQICGGQTQNSVNKRVTAVLNLENSNRHDSNAVRIDIDGSTVGYLPREIAFQYRAQLKREGRPNLIGRCNARIVGSPDRGERDSGRYNIRLDLPVT